MSGNPYGQGGYGDFTGAAAEVYALFYVFKILVYIFKLIELIVQDRSVIPRYIEIKDLSL